jgi:hypothetical protein
MRETCTSGSVGGEGGNILTYPAVPRLRLVTAPREVRDTARQALRPGCEELAARAAEEMLQTEARPPAENRHGGAVYRCSVMHIGAHTEMLVMY